MAARPIVALAFRHRTMVEASQIGPEKQSEYSKFDANHLRLRNALGFLSMQPNPMSLVRVNGVSKRVKQPRILTVEQCMAVLSQIPEPFKTMVLVAMCLGLRVSEILGLQWRDFDWEKLQIFVRRAIVLGTEGEVKTVYSSKQMPLDPALAEVVFRYRGTFGKGAEDADWVFANPDTQRPWWAHQIQQRYIRKAGIKALGVDGIGWHTFRHSYSSLLRELGVDVKVQQELLRHSDIRTTLNIYTQAVPQQLRDANSQVVRMFLGGVTLDDSSDSAKLL
jgi:integrase